MASERELNILIKAKDEASKILKQYDKEFSQMGKGLMAAGAAGAAGLGFAIKAAADFQAQMSSVGAIAGATPKELKKMSDAAMQLGASSVFSAGEVAKGMEYMAQNGFTATETIKAMPGVLDAAAASGMDLASTADLVSGALRGFRLDASQASTVADILAKVSNTSAADMNSLSYSLKYVAPLAANAGWSLADVGAALGEMGNQMIKGEQAGTTLRAVIMRLSAPTSQASKAMSALGINVRDAHGNMLPLPAIIDQFQSHLKGLDKAQQAQALRTIIGTEAMSGFQALLNDGGTALKKYSEDLKNSTGSAADTAAKKLDNFKGAIEQMRGALETAAITIGNMFLPGLTKMAQIATNVVNKFNGLPDSVKSVAVKVIAGASAFALMAGAMMIITPMLPAIGAGFAALFSPIGLVILAIGALAAAFAMNLGGVRDAVMGWIQPIITAFQYLTGGMDGVVFKGQQMGLSLETILGTKAATIVTIVQNMTTMMSQAWDVFSANVLPVIQTAWESIKTLIDVYVGTIIKIAQSLYTSIEAFWTAHGAQIQANVKQTFDIISNVIGTVTQGITAAINTAFPYIQQIITMVMTQILPVIVNVWTAINNFLQIAIPVITDIIVTAWQYVILPVIQFVMNYIAPFVISMFQKIADFISEVMPEIMQVISFAWKNVIKPIFVTVLNEIWPVVKSVFTMISTIIKGAMDIIFGIVRTVLALLTGHWSKAWDGLKQILSGVWEVIKGLVVDGIGAIFNVIKGLVKSIIGIGADMLNAGISFIEGFISGINKKAGEIVKAALDAVKGAINAVKNFLGIHSPSRLMFEIGGFTTKGLANGIKDAQKLAEGAAFDLAGSVTKPFDNGLDVTPFYGNQSGSGSGSSQTVVNLHFHEGSINLPEVSDSETFVNELKGLGLKQAFNNQ